MKSIVPALLAIFVIYFLFPEMAVSKEKNFGEISLRIDEADSIKMDIQMAFLYRNVSVEYDSTILIQNSEGSKILLYPQVSSGNQNVLRIIIGKIEDKTPTFFDVFIILGDTIIDSISWKGEREKIFITYNGILKSKKSITEDINGSIVLKRDKNGEIVSGKMNLNLLVPLYDSQDLANRLNMKGSFDLAVGDFRELTISQKVSDVEKKQKKRHNLYLAIVFTVFLIAIFGFR